MPMDTDRLKLPLPLGNENVTRESINAIFEKIDAGVATQEELHKAVSEMDIPDASLTQKGKVQLSSKTDGTSETLAATEKAVNVARAAAETSAKNASLPRSGGAMSGRIVMQSWGSFSGSPDGSTLFGSNCYLDGAKFKFENSHSTLGARGIYLRYTGSAGPEIYMFDTGPVATVAGTEFTPSLNRIANMGDAFQKHKITNDNGVTLNISHQDLNNLRVSGFYAGENITNAPTTAVGAWWYIEVIAMSGSHIKQIAMDLFNNTYQQRTNNGGGWSAWTPDLFTSVSNGKTSVAAAITGKGIPTAADAPFATMAANIGQIITGKKFATGTVTSSNTPEGILWMQTGVSQQGYYVTVTGLGFRPETIVLTLGGVTMFTYRASAVPTSSGANRSYYRLDMFNSSTQYTYVPEYTGNGGSLVYVNDSAFRLPTLYQNSEFTWVAYGI